MVDIPVTGELSARGRSTTLLQRGWRRFCRIMVRIFYRRREAHGLHKIPPQGPVLLCANHPNALADPIIIQAFCPRIVHPLARSGLFEHPLMRPFLTIIQAVPIYRRQDAGSDIRRNVESFARCHEFLAQGEVLLIFPEGQTHSDAELRTIRTGAARLARGSVEATGTAPTVLPVGLTFSRKGHFRGSVLLEVGDAVDISSLEGEQPEDTVRRVTGMIENGLRAITINAETPDDIELSRRLERFFALRRGRYRRSSLRQRFRALKKLIDSQRILRERAPEQVANLSRHLFHFERLCRHFGVHDYYLTLHYNAGAVTRFVLRTLFMLVVILPLALWGLINSGVPLILTKNLVPRLAKGSQEYDTARMTLALAVFVVVWLVQSAIVFWLVGGVYTLLYVLSLPPATAATVLMYKEKGRIVDNIRGFFLFLRKRRVRDYLEARRKELERELAQMVRILKR
ncbi:MAG: 1-acyl-sn-glycerol-3-phosphate acyltransferase [Acidiferrobacterales bacterium]